MCPDCTDVKAEEDHTCATPARTWLGELRKVSVWTNTDTVAMPSLKTRWVTGSAMRGILWAAWAMR